MLIRLKKCNFSQNLHFRLLLLGLTLLSLIGLFSYHRRKIDFRRCFLPEPNRTHTKGVGGPALLEDVLLSNEKPKPGQSIFFHETSCHRSMNPDEGGHFTAVINLKARQACAIESAALHNPNSQVFVLFASPVYKNNSTEDAVTKAVQEYSNIHFRNLNLWSYAADTPIINWLRDGQLFDSKYVFSHLSDFLRYLTLWRFGGLYLDMDIVMLKSMQDVPPNYTGAESDHSLAAGVMNFAHDGLGHIIVEECLRDFQVNFKGSDWGNNGPGVITRVMKKFCATNSIAGMTNSIQRCMGFRVFDSKAFYAIPWRQWNHFFDPEYFKDTLRLTRKSYVIHVWNKLSERQRIQGTKSAYGYFAKLNCPKVFEAAGDNF